MSGLLRCRGCGTIYQDSSSYTSHVQRCEQTAQSTQDALKNIRAPAISRRRGIAAFASSENLGAFKEKMKTKASKVQNSLKRARRDSDWGDGCNDARYSTRQSSASKSTFSSAALASDSVNELSAGPSKQRASRSSIALSATSGPPPPSSSPPPPSFCSNMDIDFCEPLEQPPPGRTPSPAPSIQPPDEHGRARRKWKPSARIRLALSDRLPEGPGQLLQRLDQAAETRVEESEQVLPTPSMDSVPRRVILHVHERVKTTANRFGLSRIYRRQPASRIPDSDLSFEQRVDVPIPEIRRRRRSITDIIYPYPNITSFLFGRHHEKMSTSGARARREDNQRMLLDDRFNPTDLCDVDFDKIDKLLAEDVQSPHGGSGWRTSSVVINVPTGAKESAATRDDNRRHTAAMRRHALDLGEGTRDAFVPYTLEGVCTRSLVHIMRSVLAEDPSSVDFHWHPYSEHWTPPYEGMDEEQVMGELYASQSFRDAERDLLASPPEPGCDLPRVIFALMFWSDATHVAQVGNSKVWPGYAFIGNQSMYMRSKPSSRAAHHFVYFPMLPDSFEDFLAMNNVNATPQLLSHCRREVFHGVWHIVLDDEFLEAYKHGIVIRCIDGITRRFYPRIFTYSADYPEKVLIATTRDMGNCPCTRCTIPKEELRWLGTPADREARRTLARKDDAVRQEKVREARQALADGFVVYSDRVEAILKDESYVPTSNAFSAPELIERRLDVFSMLTTDLMHEFELGVWKSLLLHIVRMLESLPADKIRIFNERFRLVPSFGRDTIRRFAHNVSQLSRMAARDYEDILLCIIPCLEGLLPDAHEKSVLDLLYIATYWHSLAKLRMHTSSTVKILDDLTTELGKALRHFADITCSNFRTVETDKEYQARKRAEAKRTASTKDTGTNTTQTSGKRAKGFSLHTIKLHFLGDAVDAIQRYGSLEHISTKTGELEHRVVKKRRARTSNTNIIPQLARLETRERVHDRMYEELQALDDEEKHRPSKRKRVIPPSELLPHHRISHNETGQRLYLETWLPDKHADPAFKSFIVKLKSHLLARLQGLVLVDDQPEYTDTELAAVEIQNDRLFSHSTASINFTTYDVRRDSDLVHVPPLGLHDGEDDDPMRHRDVMVHTTDEIKTYPFMYARTFMIFHAKVRLGGRGEWHSVEFLWVRWLCLDQRGGPDNLRLDRVRYRRGDRAFGFLDPAQIIRGCHLIPAFHYRRTTDLLGPSLCRDSRHGDWSKYYVGRFVDRDMMMRYLGLGVGHLNTPDFPHEIFERARFEAAAVPVPGDTQATYTEEEDEDVELDYESDGVAVGSDDEL